MFEVGNIVQVTGGLTGTIIFIDSVPRYRQPLFLVELFPNQNLEYLKSRIRSGKTVFIPSITLEAILLQENIYEKSNSKYIWTMEYELNLAPYYPTDNTISNLNFYLSCF